MTAYRLISTRRTPTASCTTALACAVLIALGGWLHRRQGTAFDDWCRARLVGSIGPSVSDVLLGCSAPQISVVVLAVVVLGSALVRRWDLAVLAAVAPALATVLTELVGKPLVGRTLRGGLAYPSGHETGVAATALVAAIALAQLPVRRGVRRLGNGVLAVWVVLAGAGLVRADWHYTTDVVGAVALATTVVLGGAVLADRAGTGRLRDPAQVSTGVS